MLDKGEYDEMLKMIDKSQLEKKYGGALPDPTTYWPPFTTIKEPPFNDQDL